MMEKDVISSRVGAHISVEGVLCDISPRLGIPRGVCGQAGQSCGVGDLK